MISLVFLFTIVSIVLANNLTMHSEQHAALMVVITDLGLFLFFCFFFFDPLQT